MLETETKDETEIGLQFALYPLRQVHLRPAIKAAVQAAAARGVAVTAGRLSTVATGDEQAVFAAIRAAFNAARSYGPTVMVVTLSSGLPSAEAVADIQSSPGV